MAPLNMETEFFKLDVIDRKVLFWLRSHKSAKTVKGWIEYVAEDYKKRKAGIIDPIKLYNETLAMEN